MAHSREHVLIICAMAAHEANRIFCRAHGDLSQAPWDDAEPWQRESAFQGVKGVFEGDTPEQSHERWCEAKRKAGWTWGPVKDVGLKTHPSMKPYAQLPASETQKDFLFVSTVRTMAAALGYTLPAAVPVSDGLSVTVRSHEHR